MKSSGSADGTNKRWCTPRNSANVACDHSPVPIWRVDETLVLRMQARHRAKAGVGDYSFSWGKWWMKWAWLGLSLVIALLRNFTWRRPPLGWCSSSRHLVILTWAQIQKGFELKISYLSVPWGGAVFAMPTRASIPSYPLLPSLLFMAFLLSNFRSFFASDGPVGFADILPPLPRLACSKNRTSFFWWLWKMESRTPLILIDRIMLNASAASWNMRWDPAEHLNPVVTHRSPPHSSERAWCACSLLVRGWSTRACPVLHHPAGRAQGGSCTEGTSICPGHMPPMHHQYSINASPSPATDRTDRSHLHRKWCLSLCLKCASNLPSRKCHNVIPSVLRYALGWKESIMFTKQGTRCLHIFWHSIFWGTKLLRN